jgi:hypothetical protein
LQKHISFVCIGHENKTENNIFNAHEQLCGGGRGALKGKGKKRKEMIKPLKIHDRIYLPW